MKQELVIAPVELVNTEIRFDYFDKSMSKDIFVTTDYRVHTDKSYVKSGDKALRHTFTEEAREFTFKWDDTDDQKNQVALMLQRHPLVDAEGNTNVSPRPIFKLINRNKKNFNSAYSLKKKGLIFNLINNTSISRMKDIAYSIGMNPTGIEPSEVFVALCDFTSGRLMQDLDKSISLIENDNNQHYVVMKKAIILDIISNRGGMFYIKSDPIGDSEDKVLNYLKENNQMYEEYVRKEVAMKDNISPEDSEAKVFDLLQPKMYDAGKDAKVKYNTPEKELELSDLRAKARGYGIKAYHQMNEDNLRAAIKSFENAQ